VEFRVLGPLEAVDGGQAVDLPRRKHRALLAALLLHAPEPVSPDRLIEDLWGENPPRTARDALQNYVSLLRKALGSDVLVTRDAGYVLEIAPDQLDLGCVDRLCAEARAADDVSERAAKLREALDLWRGPPLADLAYEPFAALEIARLDELHLAAREDLIDAELELGQHSDLVPEIEALIRDHPFDERLRGQLMLALYRAGRQAEALDVYRATRRTLDEELGLEPGPALRELEQAILTHDPALDTARPTPSAAISRRTVTVVFASLAGEEQRDPESLGGSIEPVEAAIEQHGGHAGFVGDAAVGIFGAPMLHEDDALRAIRAAAALREALPGARIGVSTGEVLAAGESVSGAPVNAARLLEQAARDGETLVAAATLRLVRDAVKVTRVKRRGRVAFRLDELIPGAPGLARRLRTPLVDREVELAALRQAFETARDERRCVVFTGLGEAGIGKTRLARELVAHVRDEATVLVGRCVSYGEGATYLPLREMIGEDFDAVFHAAGSTGEVFLATRRRFEELAQERPLLLVFEDAHWAEPTLLDLIEYLGAQSTGSPILALCLSRPDLLAERAGWTEIGPSFELQPLTDDHARELAGAQPHAERIVEIAEGNPLYVEQLAAYAEEGGAEALDTVPGSIEALLASRLDRIAPDERAFAQRAAVVGRRFSPAAVGALGPVAALPGLERAGFVHRAGTLYRFHHVLVREVVYAGTPKAERAELHRRHADWLDAQPDGSEELVGYHLEQAAAYLRELGAPSEDVAQLSEQAGRRLGNAGIRAWKRGDAATAVNLLGRATALLSEHDSHRLELLCEFGRALRSAGSFAQAEAVLTEARDKAAAAGARSLELQAEMARLATRLSVGPEDGTEALLDFTKAAIPVLEEHGDDRALGRAWLNVATVLGPYRNRHAEAERAARRAIVHYRRADWPFAACLGTISHALVSGPTPVAEALSACRALLAEADLNGQANLLPPIGVLTAMQGDFVEALELVRRSSEIHSELGQPIAFEYGGRPAVAQIELMAGDLQKAQEALEAGCRVLEQLGDRAYLATRRAMLADVLYRRGRCEEAADKARAAQSGSTSDDIATEWLWRSVEARLAARAGDFIRAQELIDEAVRMLGHTDDLTRRGTCWLDAAEVASLAGRRSDAAVAIKKAIRLFEKKGNQAATAQARTLSAETPESP
jgi:DNA-binding SARP family transcriptional activator/tetratricopeptide (TPR) repeat protein